MFINSCFFHVVNWFIEQFFRPLCFAFFQLSGWLENWSGLVQNAIFLDLLLYIYSVNKYLFVYPALVFFLEILGTVGDGTLFFI